MAEALSAWAGTNVTSLSSDQRRLHLRMVEALLFATVTPLSEAELASRMPEGVDVAALLPELQAAYAGRGVNLRRVDGCWAFRTAEDLAFLRSREVVEQRKLSRAALETLAIIAYHQPVTRAEIEEIRGVAISKGTLDVLMEAGWVKLKGRRQTPGRPVTFGTSAEFLDHFGLESLGDLPGLADLKAAGLLDTAAVLGGARRQGEDADAAADAQQADADPDDDDVFDDAEAGGRAAATIASRLTLEGVSRRFGRAAALDGIDLDVQPGQIVSLLGQSGCGKTTLLRIAAGVEVPTGGRVLVDGREVASASAFVPPERRSIGLMFQDYALFPHLSVLRNVMFGLNRLDRRTRAAEAGAALARVGLEHLATAYPHEISGGEQQRVALARAIVPRPGILLMDEPFSGLDNRLRDAVRADTLSVLRETGATAVVVTHDPQEAMRMSDRIVLMRRGRVVQQGTAEDLYARPGSLFAARFFSQLNEVEGRMASGQACTPVGDFPAPGQADGETVTVAIRPQGVRLAEAPDFGPGRPGRIVARHFLGEADLFDVAIEGLPTYLVAKARPEAGLAPGAEVRISFDPRDVLVFPVGD